jgi:hypothetical protein
LTLNFAQAAMYHEQNIVVYTYKFPLFEKLCIYEAIEYNGPQRVMKTVIHMEKALSGFVLGRDHMHSKFLEDLEKEGKFRR